MKTTFNSSLKFMAMLMIALTTVFSFSACSDDDGDAPTPAASGKLMIVHASPDAPGVDLLLDGTKLNSSDVMYTDNTAYVSAAAGTRVLKVNVAGTSTTALQASLPIVSNKNYSVFAIDSVSNLSGLFVEDNLATPASGKAHVRFIHLSPDAPAVDVAVTGGAVVFGNKIFKDFTAFTPLDANTYNLEVRLAGTSTVVLPLPGIMLTAGKIYTVYAKGFVGGTGAQALGAEIIVNN
ncbi:MAG: DUF4397 domain-containing protein [Bacteroidia bacterium]